MPKEPSRQAEWNRIMPTCTRMYYVLCETVDMLTDLLTLQHSAVQYGTTEMNFVSPRHPNVYLLILGSIQTRVMLVLLHFVSATPSSRAEYRIPVLYDTMPKLSDGTFSPLVLLLVGCGIGEPISARDRRYC